jgi:hypothetical protein
MRTVGAAKVVKRVGAAKVMTKAGPVWCHLSERNETRKLRRYCEGAVFEVVDVESDEIEEFVTLKQCQGLVPDQSTYSWENDKAWAAILRKLEATTAPSNEDSVGRRSTAAITVPITHLRRFYDVMKLLDTATWVQLAKFYSDAPASLERLWEHSQTAFSCYHNTDAWGRDKTKDLPSAPKRVVSISSTNEFTAFIKAPNNSFGNVTPGWTFVERELNPRRTRRGMYSDKRPATNSGAGGMDLLLRSIATGFPAVGEVKVKKDKNAFFALVQAMTYAVELSTPKQLTRLKTHFGDHFSDLNVERGRVEIALVMVNPVDDGTLEPVLTLVNALNDRQKCKGLGTIVLIENEGEGWSIRA